MRKVGALKGHSFNLAEIRRFEGAVFAECGESVLCWGTAPELAETRRFEGAGSHRARKKSPEAPMRAPRFTPQQVAESFSDRTSTQLVDDLLSKVPSCATLGKGLPQLYRFFPQASPSRRFQAEDKRAPALAICIRAQVQLYRKQRKMNPALAVEGCFLFRNESSACWSA
jgi:hypothetical protein